MNRLEQAEPADDEHGHGQAHDRSCSSHTPHRRTRAMGMEGLGFRPNPSDVHEPTPLQPLLYTLLMNALCGCVSDPSSGRARYGKCALKASSFLSTRSVRIDVGEHVELIRHPSTTCSAMS